MIFKEMEYKAERPKETEILVRDCYKGYEYFVISYGVHPCAYISLSKGQPFYNANSYENVNISCHGGCTFVEWGYRGIIEDSFKVIGWDYGHYTDFNGYYLKDEITRDFFEGIRDPLKKWTTVEMVKECKNVIEQLYVLEHSELFYK